MACKNKKKMFMKKTNKIQNFCCYLIDNFEGEYITEEFLRDRICDFIKSKYFKIKSEK